MSNPVCWCCGEGIDLDGECPNLCCDESCEECGITECCGCRDLDIEEEEVGDLSEDDEDFN